AGRISGKGLGVQTAKPTATAGRSCLLVESTAGGLAGTRRSGAPAQGWNALYDRRQQEPRRARVLVRIQPNGQVTGVRACAPSLKILPGDDASGLGSSDREGEWEGACRVARRF